MKGFKHIWMLNYKMVDGICVTNSYYSEFEEKTIVNTEN